MLGAIDKSTTEGKHNSQGKEDQIPSSAAQGRQKNCSPSTYESQHCQRVRGACEMVRVTTQWLAIGSMCRILGVGVINSRLMHGARRLRAEGRTAHAAGVLRGAEAGVAGRAAASPVRVRLGLGDALVVRYREFSTGICGTNRITDCSCRHSRH